ncbi:MAG: TIGR02680 family protein, partial [Clostridia bacterium]
MNRWRMHKLGFVHFWLYDLQEFPIDEGHILLRGSNASGKSITTQSFIPFLLDGNKSPERLDPFGSKDRRMEFYLLGDGEREESTGYLYLEFKKNDSNEYLTIGVGMRAQKGKSMDFWGFCLCDGRRMGDEGMRLYEKV